MRVLIVDDSDLLVERLLERVTRVSGVEVVGRSRNAAEAYSAIRRLQPDVVILDLCMPGGSGIGVLKDIKRNQLGSIVIVLTAYQEPQYRKECLEMGAKFFLDKSTQLGDIPEVLRSLLVDAPAPDAAGNDAAEPEPAGLGIPPCGDWGGSEPPAGERKTTPRPELLVSRSSKGEPIYYTCSLCLRGFVLSDAQLPKEAVRELCRAFHEHVRQEHPACEDSADARAA
jgi:DNA-binding NarL/FixJ family response regulator